MREKEQLRGKSNWKKPKKDLQSSNGGVFSGERRGDPGGELTCLRRFWTKWVFLRAKSGFWAPMEQIIFQREL